MLILVKFICLVFVTRNTVDAQVSDRLEVKASDIWSEDDMKEMLGVTGSRPFVNQQKMAELPSLLTAFKNSASTTSGRHIPSSCKLPGYPGNVVRTFRNKGDAAWELTLTLKTHLLQKRKSLHRKFELFLTHLDTEHKEGTGWPPLCQSQNVSLFDLRFVLDDAFPNYENVTQADVSVRFRGLAPKMLEPSKDAPRARIALWETHKQHLSIPRDICSHGKTEKSLFMAMGEPLIQREFEFVHSDTVRLNIMNSNQLSKGNGIRKEFRIWMLVTATSKLSKFANPKTSILLVSLDRRQCPLPVTSYLSKGKQLGNSISDDDVLRSRAVRDLSQMDDSQSTDGDIKSRNNRHSKREASRSTTICRERPMWVSFEDLEWGKWIIAPRGFYANRCEGDCPFPLGDKLNATNHAVLLTLMNTVEPHNAPLPCCVPTHLTPISLLYFDSGGNVVLRQYEDMIVQSCGCR